MDNEHPYKEHLTFEDFKKAVDRVMGEPLTPPATLLTQRDEITYNILTLAESWESYRYPIRHRLMDVYRILRHERDYYPDNYELWLSIKWTLKMKSRSRLTEAAKQEIEDRLEEYDRGLGNGNN